MSRRTAISILESCRLCGVDGAESKNRHFLYGIEENDELLTILRSVLPIVIYPEDPLSKWICTGCREKVMRFYGISREYTKYFGKCLGALRKVDPEQTYLQICSDVETFAATLEDSLLEKMPSAVFDRKRLIMKGRGGAKVAEKKKLKERKSGEVPTLFETCIDYINSEGPKLLSTYLHVESNAEWNETEMEPSESSMSFFEDEHTEEESHYFDTSAVECNVKITEGYAEQKDDYRATTTAGQQNGIGKKRKLSRQSMDLEPIERPTRAKSRVNYSEDMIDEALFYEQIMLEEYKRRARSPKKEEQPPVYKQRQVAAKGTHPRNSIASFPLKDIREQLKTDPTQVIQVNSELSIHLKTKEPREVPWMPLKVPKWEPKREPTEAPREIIVGAWDPNGRIPVDCKFCHKKFQNLAVLSKHQLRHLVLQLKKLDTPEILQPKFRRYSYRFPNFRCCNCLSYYTSKEALKAHWGNGECEYFCRICRAPFHRNRPELHKHYFMAHGVRFNETIFTVSGNEVDESKICTICYCTFPNFQSRNSHMKIHKKKGEFSLPATPSTSTPPSFQAHHSYGPRPRLQINQALQMEIKRMEYASHQRFNGMASSSQMTPRPPMTHILPPPRFPAPGPAKTYTESSMGDVEMPAARISYSCIPCGGKYPNKKELYQHKRTCQQLLRTCCHLCWKQFTTTSEFENHMRIHHQ